MAEAPITSKRSTRPARRGVAMFVLFAMLSLLSVIGPTSPDVAAQVSEPTVLSVWGLGVNEGVVDNPKDWKFTSSNSVLTDIGSAAAADPMLDDSAWETRTLAERQIPGSNVAMHYRKDFNLEDLGVELFQIVGMQVQLHYDDSAVLYLNGTEVYRSIRGNLDPTYETYAVGDDIPFDVSVPWGGFENQYVRIPDPDMINECEFPTGCTSSPYGSPQPPPIDPSLLVEGTNTWAFTVWNNSNGGSGDTRADHIFELLVDENALPPSTVFINEVMASNDTAWGVDWDGDMIPDEFPDWIELRNVDTNNAVDLAGWTIADSGASFTLPSVTIPAGGYLMLAANDGNDGSTSPPQLNFKLSASGDSVKLTTIDGVVADEYVWTDQFVDNSFGRSFNLGDPTFLSAPTPELSNDVPALTDAPPVLRTFVDRLYNPGETVALQIDAFDPDGDDLSYTMNPMPDGLVLDPMTGAITGTADWTTDVLTTITVIDADNDTDDQQDIVFARIDPVASPAPLVLNEYNAVPNDRELIGGSPLGNGGDWFEFLVLADDVDLRGYTIELRDLKGPDDTLRVSGSVTFADDPLFRRMPAGTIITISEVEATDLSFDAVDDWSINLQITNEGFGARFTAPPVEMSFNSTRAGQAVLIRDGQGNAVTPMLGEYDGWDDAAGGVSGGEVMNLCTSPTAGYVVDPITDYRDNGAQSTFGEPNVCVFPDPLDPAQFITQVQDLTALRASAALGAESGDVNCDFGLDILDALVLSQYTVGLIADSGPCLLDQGGPDHVVSVASADFDQSGVVDILDALVIARCTVGLPTPIECP